MEKHAVHLLFEKRLAQCTKPFNARGGQVIRCDRCRIQLEYCLCDLTPDIQTDAAFLLLYYDDEILKPSNTGKLIADIAPETFAYIWNRTEVDSELLAVLTDEQWFPVVVFPSEYVEDDQRVMADEVSIPSGKRPLFVLLDGSWREAKKMFRKSPYLDHLPVLSITPEKLSAYQVRKASRDYQLATAEVAAQVLNVYGETYNAEVLQTWFELFSFRYQKGVMKKNQGDATAEERLMRLLAKE